MIEKNEASFLTSPVFASSLLFLEDEEGQNDRHDSDSFLVDESVSLSVFDQVCLRFR